MRLVGVAIRDEAQHLGDDVVFGEIWREGHDRGPRGSATRSGMGITRGRIVAICGRIVQRIDRAEQRAAEGRARRGERAVGVDGEFGAVGGQAGQQRRRDRAGEIAAERWSRRAAGFPACTC